MNIHMLDAPIFFIVGLVIATIVHEIGHALCAKIVGIPIRLITFGSGPVIARLGSPRTRILLQGWPLGGAVHNYPPFVVTRWRFSFYAAGGALGNMAGLALIVALWLMGLSPGWAGPEVALVAAAQLIVGLGNLIPRRCRGWIWSDGLALLKLKSLPAQTVTSQSDCYAKMRALYCGGEAPRPSCSDSICMAYYLCRLETWTSHLERREFREAAEAVLLRAALAPDEEMLVLDGLVTIGAITHDPDYLCSLDEWSRRALSLNPTLDTLRGSRGAALVALGRYAEGKALLASVDANAAPRDFAISQVFLAKAQLTLDDTTAARKSLAAARRVDAAAIAWEPLAAMISDMELALKEA